MSSLDALFRPRSVAVVGASARRGGLGREILENLLAMPFAGTVFPVNPQADVIHCLKSYPSVEAIPDPVDLAVLVVPRDRVLPVVDDCARKGVKGLVVITAGFKEVGEEGRLLEEELVRKVRLHGMRLVGPNCMGVINTHPDFSMNATFARSTPRPGRVAFMSQSGAMGAVILDYAAHLGLGLSMFASLGNKPDVQADDLLEYWRDDPETDIILLYLENFGDPRKFATLAREISRRKPLIAVKSGRTAAGARAAISHTGVLAGLDVAVDALFEQCGVLRANSLQEMFHLARFLTHRRPPKGRKVAVVSNGGGPAIMTTDAVIGAGLAMAEFEPDTLRTLRDALPPEASSVNPVDLIASADPARYRLAMERVLADPNVDACIVIFVSTVAYDPSDMFPVVEEVAAATDKPVLASYMGAEAQDDLAPGAVPVYPFPEEAVRTLAQAARYGRWLAMPEGTVPPVEGKREEAARLIAGAEGRTELTLDESARLLELYGVPFARREAAADRASALRAADLVGYPVVMKAAVEGLSHKSDAGGVAVDLRHAAELADAWERMQVRLEAALGRPGPFPVEIQEMVRGAREVIVGVVHDPNFGPLLMFGVGGIYVEVFGDVTFRVHPLTDRSARDMIRDVKGFPLLEGVRGEEGVDLAFLEEILLKVSGLVTNHPEIGEMDLNPVMVGPRRDRCRVVDARVALRTS